MSSENYGPIWQLLTNAKNKRLAGEAFAKDIAKLTERRDECFREAMEYETAANILINAGFPGLYEKEGQ